jgi:hypothetical protein
VGSSRSWIGQVISNYNSINIVISGLKTLREHIFIIGDPYYEAL